MARTEGEFLPSHVESIERVGGRDGETQRWRKCRRIGGNEGGRELIGLESVRVIHDEVLHS